jgi:ABC-type multidrug transport system fused ATPase/permease subunit
MLQSVSMCFAGILFAFYIGWWFSLILLIYFPLYFVSTYFIARSMQSGFFENMKSYGQSAGYAE